MLSENRHPSSQHLLRDIVFLGLALMVFYTLWLGSYPLFTPDEGRYSEVAREMMATHDYITPRVDGVAFLDKPVLYYWLQAAAMRLFGIKEWAVRFFPVVFGVFGCLLTYLSGRRLFDRRTGVISALMLAATPLYFIGAHYANLDLEVAVLISSTLLFFITGVQCTGKSRTYLLMLAYIAAALAFLTKGLIGIAFPAMIAGLWMILLNQWKLLTKIHLIKGVILAAMIVLPWYYLVQQANPEFLHYFFVTQQVTRFLSSAEFNNPTPFWFYLPIVLIGFFPWTGFLLQACTDSIRRILKARHTHQTELFLLIWIFVIFLFFSFPRSKMITYILPVFPALALLVGRYLSSMWERTNSRDIYLGILSVITLSIAAAITLVSTAHYHWIDIPAGFKPYLNIIVIVLVLNAWVSILIMRRKNLLPVFVMTAISSMLILLTIMLGAKHLNQNSAKPLVATLKTIVQPEDEVIHYFRFYQDVPLYLERRVTLVADWTSPKIPYKDNWVRELWYGMPFQNTADWLITENIFWERWNGNKRVFVFLSSNYFQQFKMHTNSYYFIGKHQGIMLLSNKPTVLHSS